MKYFCCLGHKGKNSLFIAISLKYKYIYGKNCGSKTFTPTL